MELFGYIGAVLTGVSLGLIGGGGSILIVPILVYLFGKEPTIATAYSLFVVGVASLIGSQRYAKQKLIDYKTGAVFAIPSFAGVFVARRLLIPALPETIFSTADFTLSKGGLIMTVFAVVMLMASLAMIRRKNANTGGDSSGAAQLNYPLIAIEGLGVGALTGFVGAGGGFLIIPALVLLAKIPMKIAVGTSLLIIAVKSLFGFLGDVGGAVDLEWAFLLKITLAASLGIFGGTYLSKFVPGKKLEPAFGWFVLVMGIYILAKQFV